MSKYLELNNDQKCRFCLVRNRQGLFGREPPISFSKTTIKLLKWAKFKFLADVSFKLNVILKVSDLFETIVFCEYVKI